MERMRNHWEDIWMAKIQTTFSGRRRRSLGLIDPAAIIGSVSHGADDPGLDQAHALTC